MALLLATFLLGFALFTHNGAASYELVQSGYLPSKRSETASFYDGQESVFIIGGYRYWRFDFFGISIAFDDVLQYNVTSGSLRKVGAIEPNVYGGAIGTDGTANFFHFGGYSIDWYTNETRIERKHRSTVYQFTEETPEPFKVSQLPVNMTYACAVSDNAGSVYLLGGVGYSDVVYRYNTQDGTTTVAGHLPQPIYGGAASWVNGSIYAIGGLSSSTEYSYKILKFTPEDGTSEVLDVTLPVRCFRSSAVTVGTDIYILGGMFVNHEFTFLKFDTLTYTLHELEITNINRERSFPSAVYVESQNRIYTFGGYEAPSSTYHDEIAYVQL